MGFLSICTAVYDYQPQSTGELELHEGELLYIIEKSSDDDWWKAKKKAGGDDEDEPEGLIPNNYVEDANPTHKAKALYDYTRQTDEEVSFSEDASLDIFDSSDPDWTLIGVNGEYGFAPANYIELLETTTSTSPVAPPRPAMPPTASEPEQELSPPASPVRSTHGPAANLARVLGGGPSSPSASRNMSSSMRQSQFTPEASEEEEEAPALPRRPVSQATQPTAMRTIEHEPQEPAGVLPSPPYNRATHRPEDEDTPIRSPGGFHLYNINEMVSSMGRRRKMPTTLGLNIATGTIMLSPEKSRDGPSQEWTADKLHHYSIEGKHVFLELLRPSKSLDLHAGAKDTAQEIVAGLGEIAGAHRAEGFKEVVAAASGTSYRKGVVLYDFMAQGEDEVTVGVADEVIVLDDTKSEEWWNVRRVKNGSEGVMPSSYIEITGVVSGVAPTRSGINAGKSPVEQNRLEEERLTKEAARANRAVREAEEARSKSDIQLPERGSSLGEDIPRASRKDKRSSKSESKSRSKPDPGKTRTWTDHSGSFKVEAQFIGVADGKIHLHKVNGVKIAVPITKMSQTDLDFVEKVIKEPIEEHVPIADLIKMKRKNQASESQRSGAFIEPTKPKGPEYDWFDFFLSAGVGPHQCERYAQAMIRDSMDESVLPDISTDSLRALGLKEGDALKVMKFLDQKYGRSRSNGVSADGNTGGIFTGPGGALRNNTSRSRPEANRQASDVVDASTLQQSGNSDQISETRALPQTQAPKSGDKGGFEDDAWTVKPPSQSAPTSKPAPTPASVPKTPSENLQALSLLDKPLEPTPAYPPQPVSQTLQTQVQTQQSQQAPSHGPDSNFNPQLNQQVGQPVQPQMTGYSQMPQLHLPRQRPQPPQQSYPGSLLPPPPRPTSAPQNPQNSQFGVQPLQPQLTGIPRSAANQTVPGQSLDELTAQRMQQRYLQLQPQPTGYGYGGGMMPQPAGLQPPQQFGQFQQPYLNGNASGSPFADPRSSFQPQPTGFSAFQQNGGVNSLLPPALQPQRTGFAAPPSQAQANGANQFQPMATGFQPSLQPQPAGFQQTIQPQMTGYPQAMLGQSTGFGQLNGFGNNQLPPVPSIPQQPTIAPLLPQKTGPAPNIKFGISEAKKLQPQPTGRRANLAHATPQNPFGF